MMFSRNTSPSADQWPQTMGMPAVFLPGTSNHGTSGGGALPSLPLL
jgi:hypothetical protein